MKDEKPKYRRIRLWKKDYPCKKLARRTNEEGIKGWHLISFFDDEKRWILHFRKPAIKSRIK